MLNINSDKEEKELADIEDELADMEEEAQNDGKFDNNEEADDEVTAGINGKEKI